MAKSGTQVVAKHVVTVTAAQRVTTCVSCGWSIPLPRDIPAEGAPLSCGRCSVELEVKLVRAASR